MLDIKRLPALNVSHHSLPLLQVFLHQPVDETLNLLFDLFRHVCQHLLLELGSDFVPAHQSQDIGEAQGVVEEIEAALFEPV